jgi:hypothetical protein
VKILGRLARHWQADDPRETHGAPPWGAPIHLRHSLARHDVLSATPHLPCKPLPRWSTASRDSFTALPLLLLLLPRLFVAVLLGDDADLILMALTSAQVSRSRHSRRRSALTRATGS